VDTHKPNSVMISRDLHVATIYLSDIPVCLEPERNTVHTYFVLLLVGFAYVPYHYDMLCALTAHFHPYRFTVKMNTAVFFCGTFQRFHVHIPHMNFVLPHLLGVRTFLL